MNDLQAADFLAVESHVQDVCKALAARLFAAGTGWQLTGQEVKITCSSPLRIAGSCNHQIYKPLKSKTQCNW
jgi:hypothetical protein